MLNNIVIADINELKVFVDLASISAGENDLDVDRVACFHDAVHGYSSMLYGLRQDSDFEDFKTAATKLWKALENDKDILLKLVRFHRFSSCQSRSLYGTGWRVFFFVFFFAENCSTYTNEFRPRALTESDVHYCVRTVSDADSTRTDRGCIRYHSRAYQFIFTTDLKRTVYLYFDLLKNCSSEEFQSSVQHCTA